MAAHLPTLSTPIEARKSIQFASLPSLVYEPRMADDVLYASRGYTLLRATVKTRASHIEWEPVGEYRPAAWRAITGSSRLGWRLFRDGFHALVALSSGRLVGAVPHAIVELAPGETEFRVSQKVLRGTRPLHLATTPNDYIFWGEYFDNPRRDEVHIYLSTDQGAHWEVAHTFPKGSIRHVHNIVYDEWENCLWVLTGDRGSECCILRASCDFKTWTLSYRATSKPVPPRWFPHGTRSTFLPTRHSRAIISTALTAAEISAPWPR